MISQKHTFTKISKAVPPQLWFSISAIFHYLGPSFAVLLFPAIGVLGVAWFRVATAAILFAPFTHPLKTLQLADRKTRWFLLSLGFCLAVMNVSFYLALDRLPMSLVAAMEFVGTIAVALYGLRTKRNVIALCLVIIGVVILIDIKWLADLIGLFWAGLNALLFTGYIVLGHKAAEGGASAGIERLGAAMMIAFILLLPVGFYEAAKVFGSLYLVLAGIAVGICSSVIPYICDQLSMSQLPRESFALLLALLPTTATIVAAVVLSQIPTGQDLCGIALVMVGIAVHKT
ncbi:MAG: EamA family transporter [Halopseudomonas aestusnigri]